MSHCLTGMKKPGTSGVGQMGKAVRMASPCDNICLFSFPAEQICDDNNQNAYDIGGCRAKQCNQNIVGEIEVCRFRPG